MSTLGWTDFDEDIVDAINRRDPAFVDLSEQGSLRSPIRDDGTELRWRGGNYRNGTEVHGDVRFRISPTYIYENAIDNFIAGHELVEEALSGAWRKAETTRLGYENSEDALSWNVFRSLQEAGELARTFETLTGAAPGTEPRLILWGRTILDSSTGDTPELQRALDLLEPNQRRQTEPDIILCSPDAGWLFVEAKLSSPAPTLKSETERLSRWIDRYAKTCPEVFDRALLENETGEFPQQILRNIAVASKIGEHATVITLVRERDADGIDEEVGRFVRSDSPVAFGTATWEGLYRSLPRTDELAPLQAYLENKSVCLRRAFDLML